MGEKKTFKFRIVYFKPSGKYYTETTEEYEIRTCGGVTNIPYMNDVVAKIRGLRDSGGQGSMPGLNSQSEGWDGLILIDCEQGFPCLILPSGVNL